MSLAPMQAPSLMAQILGALKGKKASTAPGAVIPVSVDPQPVPPLLAAPSQIPPALQPEAQNGQIWGQQWPMVDEAETMPVEEPESPLSLYRPGSLSLPTRQYDIPQAPTMRGLPALPQRDMAQDARRGLDVAGVGALAGLLLGGGRGAVAGTLGAGRGYMGGRDRVAAQDRQNYGDQLNQTLRLNSQDQQGYQNAMAALSRQMQADNYADTRKTELFKANETANREGYKTNANIANKREETALRAKADEFKRVLDTSKDKREQRKAVADLLLAQARAEKLGFDILDRTAKRKLEEWEAKNRVATAKYNAESNRMAVGNGATYQQGQLSLRGKELGLREREIENNAGRQAQTDQQKAQAELLKIQEGFPKVDADIAKLRAKLRDGNPVPVYDPVSGALKSWNKVPLSPEEARDVEGQIQGLQAAKRAAAGMGQQLKLRAGVAAAPELPRTPAPGKGKLAPVGIKLNKPATPAAGKKALKDMSDAELKKAIAKKFGGA